MPFGTRRAAASSQKAPARRTTKSRGGLEARGHALQSRPRPAKRQSIRIEQVKLGEGASPREVSIEVMPLGPDRQDFLIVFEDQAAARSRPRTGEAPTANGKRTFAKHISRLEKELASGRAHLNFIIEQEAANEEVIAANEELNSLNEELEGSKEELEATNEELTTVNQELQVRNIELESAREFAQATIDTVRSALLVLGPDLRVLKANQAFYRTFGGSPAEVERRFIYALGDGCGQCLKASGATRGGPSREPSCRISSSE